VEKCDKTGDRTGQRHISRLQQRRLKGSDQMHLDWKFHISPGRLIGMGMRMIALAGLSAQADAAVATPLA